MKTKQQFIHDLKESDYAVQSVYMWAILNGYDAEKPDLQFHTQDSGDILIQKRIEVKHMSLDFNKDFPYSGIIIDEAHKVKNLNTLEMYVILNKSKTVACIIKPDSEEYWYEKLIFDKVYKEERMFMMCPKQYATFIDYP